MSLTFEYGRHAVALPFVPESLLAKAGKTELQLLLALVSSRALRESYEENADALAATLHTNRAALDSALSFWIGAGLLVRETDGASETAAVRVAEPTPTVPVPRRTVVTELPHYTADELDRVLAGKVNSETFISEAQRALGVVFTSHSQVAQLIAISEGLGVSDEYLLLLLAYCGEKGKKTLRYAEKLAVSLVDANVTTPEALSEHFRAMEAAESAEGKIRRLFGLTRTLTGKEKGFVADWTLKYGFGEEMLEKAYEFAVEATANPTLNYVNSILVRWHGDHITTPEEADREREAHRTAESPAPSRKQRKTTEETKAKSFDVDDFFTAAMSRGYGEPSKTDQ